MNAPQREIESQETATTATGTVATAARWSTGVLAKSGASLLFHAEIPPAL
jgi:hypothetical protein